MITSVPGRVHFKHRRVSTDNGSKKDFKKSRKVKSLSSRLISFKIRRVNDKGIITLCDLVL